MAAKCNAVSENNVVLTRSVSEWFATSVKGCLTANRAVMSAIGFSSKTPLIGRFPCLWGRNLVTTLAQPLQARNPARF